MTTRILVVDTETTGLDPAKDAVVQFAAVEVVEVVEGHAWGIVGGSTSFVAPHRPIPAEASAIHHIIDADLTGAPDLAEAIDLVLGKSWQDRVDIVAAHVCRFDRDFLPPLRDKRWIDTYRCAMHVWPDAPNFQNQTLRYWLGLDLPRGGSHTALADVTVTAHVLCRLLAERSLDELLRLSTKAAVLKKVLFGRHFGKSWSEVPWGYLEWTVRQIDMDADVKFTARTELTRRRVNLADKRQSEAIMREVENRQLPAPEP